MIQFCAECGRRLLNEWCVWCARQAEATHIDRYEVRQAIGTGSFGNVLLARDPRLGRLVALRVVNLQGDDRAEHENYIATVGSIAGLSHPNLVDLYAILSPSGEQETFVVVMEYVDGPTLEKAASDLRPSEVIQLLDGAMSGLEFLHSQGIAHGRISPGNVLVSKSRVSKLADAGLGEDPGSPRAWALAPPEVLLGDGPSQSADVFSAAAIAWWLISRHPPFEADDRKQAVIRRHKKPSGQVPEELRSILLGALDANPTNRPSATALHSELENGIDVWRPDWRRHFSAPAHSPN